MFQIVRKQEMAKGTIIRFDINAPKIAKKVKAGQFVILRVNETGERIPLTVADKDEFAVEFKAGDCLLIPASYEGVMKFSTDTEYLTVTL